MARKSKKKQSNDNDNGSAKTYTGKLEVTRGGMGFVIVEGLERDIAVRESDLNTALNGDLVEVKVRDGGGKKSSRMQGEVVRVTQRKQSEFSGKLQVKEHFAFLVSEKKNMSVDIFIPLHALNGAKDGDRAAVKVTEWSSQKKNPVGEVIRILTQESANEVAMQEILMESGFPLDFPEEVLEETARISEIVDEAEASRRRDMRDTLTFTIDPVDARDFDDAISFKELEAGVFEVGVHIADVSHYMQPDTALDKEAYQRATSVYLPDRVLPMLPERLSNELCSLRPDEDKFTFSAVFKMRDTGEVLEYWLGRTVIRSKRRFTYEDAQQIIETGSGDHAEVVLLLNKIARQMRGERMRTGAINFSSQEVRFRLDENAVPVEVVVKESKESHQLIEEFMLLANKTVAMHVASIGEGNKAVPFPYRIHDVPDEDKLSLFTLFAARYGYRFDTTSPQTIAQSFNEMLRAVKGKPEQHVLETLGIRTMSKAVYSTENIGHYGLGFRYYCHFTSPIRRYPDVLVHRVLQECLDNNVHPDKKLEQKCRHCSDQERRAMESERSANKYKQVEYISKYVGYDFEAVISGVASFGFWAETVEHKCEGMVSITDLAEFDDFQHVEQEYALVGMRTGVRLQMGDAVKVRVASANLERRQIDFALLQLPEQDGRELLPIPERKALKRQEPKGGRPGHGGGGAQKSRGGDKGRSGDKNRGGKGGGSKRGKSGKPQSEKKKDQ